MSTPTLISNLGDELAEAINLATSMLRDCARNEIPIRPDAAALLELAQKVSALVLEGNAPIMGALPFPGGAVHLGDLVELDDKGAQAVMASQHHAAADRLEYERATAGISSLLNDTAGAANSDRDHRLQETG